MNVGFYIPRGEVIPTKLRLVADGHYVQYEQLNDAFGYDFMFLGDVTVEKALELTKGIASIMCSQSYDHGAQWRVVLMEVVEQDERYKIGEIVRVLFRVRDAG